MQINSEARTRDVRALATSVVLGAALGLGVGGAYLAGVVIQARTAAAPRAEAAAARAEPAPALALAREKAWRPWASAAAGRGVVTAAMAGGADPADRRGAALCLAQAVYYEARGESPTGQAAVAQVVLNRLRQPAFPKTVCAVVFQRSAEGCQFSFTCNGALRSLRDEDAWRKAQAVAGRALAGAVMSEVRGATMFQTAVSAGRGAFAGGVLQVAQIGAHVFYRLNGRDAKEGVHPPVERDAVERGLVRQGAVHLVFASIAPAPAATPPAPRPIVLTASDAAPAIVPAASVEAPPARPAPAQNS